MLHTGMAKMLIISTKGGALYAKKDKTAFISAREILSSVAFEHNSPKIPGMHHSYHRHTEHFDQILW
jgi:hypothetical protein